MNSLAEIARQVVTQALSRGATEADALAVEDESTTLTVRLRSIDTLKSAREKGLGLRVFWGKSSATTSTSDFSPASLDTLVEETCTLARATVADEYAGLPDPSHIASTIPDLDLSDDAPREMSLDAKIALAREAEAAALGADPRITNSEGAGYEDHFTHIAYAASHGFVGEYASSVFSLSATPVATEDGMMERDYWYSTSRKFSLLEPAASIGRRAAERTLRRLGARKVKTQEVPVIFDPEMAASLLRSLFSACSGTAIYKGTSFLVGKLGERIASDIVTLVDDGTQRAALGSKPFDAEGLPTRKTAVVEKGILQTYLCDTYSARKLGARPTGNASRGLGDVPGVAPTNFFLTPGSARPEEIIRSVENGLYVTELIGFGVNLVTGDYSRGAVGLWIEKGKLAYPVEEITIAGNLKTMLRDIEMVGNDLAFRDRVASPTLKIRRMTVAGE